MKRVVITGIGIYSCIGASIEEVRQSLMTGRSGIVFDQDRKDFGFRSGLTGWVELPNLKGKLDRRQRASMAEQCAYAYVATEEAMKMSGIDNDFLAANETGLIYGNDSSAQAVIDSIDKIREKKDTTLIGSGAIFKAMNSTVTMNLATIYKVTGINLTISAACASGSHSLGLAYHMIKHGYQDRIICGGAQEINKYSMGSFDGLSAFSIRENEPHKASRPFDRDRDGLIPSGGAATLIVESLESAEQRGVPILAEIVGYGFSSNGAHISKPNTDGQRKSLFMCLDDASMSPTDIDYINAHATSTPVGDRGEAESIFEVFGERGPWVSSTKSMTGHECWMAGASEAIYTLIMMQNGFIAPNINFENPDDASEKLKIAASRIDTDIDVALSNSFGFGGTNSSIIFRKL